MKTLSNSPPPFKTGEFDLIFYFYFSTDQNRNDSVGTSDERKYQLFQ